MIAQATSARPPGPAALSFKNVFHGLLAVAVACLLLIAVGSELWRRESKPPPPPSPPNVTVPPMVIEQWRKVSCNLGYPVWHPRDLWSRPFQATAYFEDHPSAYALLAACLAIMGAATAFVRGLQTRTTPPEGSADRIAPDEAAAEAADRPVDPPPTF